MEELVEDPNWVVIDSDSIGENEGILRMDEDDIDRIYFFYEKKEVGCLSWKDGVFKFEGDTEKSARVFFNYLNSFK